MADLGLDTLSAVNTRNNIVSASWDAIVGNNDDIPAKWDLLSAKSNVYSTIRISGTHSSLPITAANLYAHWSIINKISTAGFSLSVDADSASLSLLTFLSSKISKVASISNLTVSSSQTVTELTNLLAKATTAHVTADYMTTSQLAIVANKIANVASSGISGALSLSTTNLNETQIESLLNKIDLDNTTVHVNATNMAAAELTKISARIDALSPDIYISNLTLSKTQTVAQINTLLSHVDDSGRGASVNVTSMSNAQLAAVANNHSAVSAIIGTLAISHNTVTTTQMGYLLDLSSDATVNINAASMSSAELSVVYNYRYYVDSITKLAISSTGGINLLSYASAATVNATGLSGNDLGTISTNIGNIASNGITGTFSITSSLSSILSKTATAATVSVSASELNGDQLSALSSNISKVDSISDLTLTSAQSAPVITNLLTKASAVSVNAGTDETHMDAGQLAAIASKPAAISSITGTLAISTTGLNETQIATLLSKASSTNADVTVTINANNMTTAELAAVEGVLDFV